MPIALGVLLIGLPLRAFPVPQALPKILITLNIDSKQSDHVQGVGELASQTFNAALREKYPCLDIMQQSDVNALLKVARDRELLGTPGRERDLANIGGAVGRDYVVYITATSFGKDKVQVNGSVLNVRTVKAVTRQAATVAGDDDDAVRSIEKFAGDLASGFDLPNVRCPGPWQGTLVFKLEYREETTKNGGTYIQTALHGARCTVEPETPRQGKCSASVTVATTERCPNGRDCSTTMSGKGDATARVFFGVEDGVVTVLIDDMSIPVKISGPGVIVAAEEPIQFRLGGWRAEATAGTDMFSQSGTRTLNLAKTKTTESNVTLTWEMRR